MMKLEDHFFEPGSEDHPGSIKLETRTRKWIRNEQYDEFHPEQLKAAKLEMERSYRGIVTRSLTATYNCHGLTFASRRTAVYESDDVQMILDEDGYKRLENRNDVERGDIVVFRRNKNAPISHTGLVIDWTPDLKTSTKKVTILSQWGRNGEYIHDEETALRAFGDVCEFYSERCILD